MSKKDKKEVKQVKDFKSLNLCDECGKEKVRLLNGRIFCLHCRIKEIKKDQKKDY